MVFVEKACLLAVGAMVDICRCCCNLRSIESRSRVLRRETEMTRLHDGSPCEEIEDVCMSRELKQPQQ